MVRKYCGTVFRARIHVLFFLAVVVASAAFIGALSGQQPSPADARRIAGGYDTFAGFATNRAAVFKLWVKSTTNVSANPNYWPPNHPTLIAMSNRLPAEVFQRTIKTRLAQPQYVTNYYSFTNRVLAHWVPESLNHAVFTNIISRTNGRTSLLWSTRRHSIGWPLNKPNVAWNRDNLAWGINGLTALSPCWQQEGSCGQVPITLLTPRHGYTRGHGMGPEGFRTAFNGKRVWFVSTNDTVIEAKIRGAIVRSGEDADYTILMFDRDLPPEIQPMRVVSTDELFPRFVWLPSASPPVLMTEQGGRMGVELPGFSVAAHKGGDSGSPNMIVLGSDLVFYCGRTTSGPSAKMQADINDLCARQKVNPKAYQLRWADLSAFPKYN